MSNLYENIGRPSVKHSAKISKLTEPLKRFFGVDRFWRNSHGIEGDYSLLGNHPPTAEVFFGENMFVGHPYFRHPRFFRSGYTLPEMSQSPDYESTQGRLRSEGSCYHVLIHIRKHAHGFVEYGFARSAPLPGFETTYLNNLYSINKFVDYFESHASGIIQETDDYRVNIPDLVGKAYHERPDLAGDMLVPEKELQFLAALENEPGKTQSILSLTKSERACLGYYLSGNTAKEIAQKVHRSPRTIETHLENAKGKLGIRTRSELFDLLLTFRHFFYA